MNGHDGYRVCACVRCLVAAAEYERAALGATTAIAAAGGFLFRLSVPYWSCPYQRLALSLALILGADRDAADGQSSDDCQQPWAPACARAKGRGVRTGRHAIRGGLHRARASGCMAIAYKPHVSRFPPSTFPLDRRNRPDTFDFRAAYSSPANPMRRG